MIYSLNSFIQKLDLSITIIFRLRSRVAKSANLVDGIKDASISEECILFFSNMIPVRVFIVKKGFSRLESLTLISI